MKRSIIIWPDSILRRVCEPIPKVDDDIKRLLADMEETMLAVGGAGLSAPQVGFALRAVVIVAEKLAAPMPDSPVTATDRVVLKLINPVIVKRSDKLVKAREGCLSLPGYFDATERAESVTVEALDENGQKVEIEGDGKLAVALQHELDHLDGKVFVDQLSQLKRDRVQRKFSKAKRRGMKYVFEGPPPQDFAAPH